MPSFPALHFHNGVIQLAVSGTPRAGAQAEATLKARFHLRGTARLLWDYTAPLGPDQPTSDATLHKLTASRHAGLEMDGHGWRVVRTGDAGAVMVLASGSVAGREDWAVDLNRSAGKLSVSIDGNLVWSGESMTDPGAMGWLLEPDTYLSVTEFTITGAMRPAHRS